MTELNHNLRGLALGAFAASPLWPRSGGLYPPHPGRAGIRHPRPHPPGLQRRPGPRADPLHRKPGDLALRQAISRFERQSRGLDYAPEEILIPWGPRRPSTPPSPASSIRGMK